MVVLEFPGIFWLEYPNGYYTQSDLRLRASKYAYTVSTKKLQIKQKTINQYA